MQQQQLIFARSVQSPSAVGPSHPCSQPDARFLTKNHKARKMTTITKVQITNKELLMALTALVRESNVLTAQERAAAEVREYETKMVNGEPGMELTIAW